MEKTFKNFPLQRNLSDDLEKTFEGQTKYPSYLIIQYLLTPDIRIESFLLNICKMRC